MRHTSRVFLSLLLAFPLALSAVGSAFAYPVENLKPIGSSTFKWGILRIYDGALYNKDGDYGGIESGLALKLDYRRNIPARRLIDITRDQWKDLALYQEAVSEKWLQQLQQLWPDIDKGDSITLYVSDDLGAIFYLNDTLLGSLPDAEFTRAFLSIWLASNASFPEFRNALIGAN